MHLVIVCTIKLNQHLVSQVDYTTDIISVHGGKVVQRSILISKQKLYNGSNIFLLVKGFGDGDNDKGNNTQDLLGMYPSDSLSLHACL